jgi:hypothetical protein
MYIKDLDMIGDIEISKKIKQRILTVTCNSDSAECYFYSCERFDKLFTENLEFIMKKIVDQKCKLLNERYKEEYEIFERIEIPKSSGPNKFLNILKKPRTNRSEEVIDKFQFTNTFNNNLNNNSTSHFPLEQQIKTSFDFTSLHHTANNTMADCPEDDLENFNSNFLTTVSLNKQEFNLKANKSRNNYSYFQINSKTTFPNITLASNTQHESVFKTAFQNHKKPLPSCSEIAFKRVKNFYYKKKINELVTTSNKLSKYPNSKNSLSLDLFQPSDLNKSKKGKLIFSQVDNFFKTTIDNLSKLKKKSDIKKYTKTSIITFKNKVNVNY